MTERDPLRLGFFIQPVHPPTRGYADVLREDRDAVVLADRLGYREAFIGEHLVDAAETITSSLAFIAHVADACPSITFGTGVLPLANYHPAMAAAHVAMVDHLVQGRLVLGIGPGVPGDAEAIGDLGTDRKRKAQEAIEHMLRIWSEDPPYRIAGDFYRTTTERSLNRQIGVGIAVRPLQRPHPPIAITSIRPDGAGRRRREAAAGPASPPPTSAPTSSGRILRDISRVVAPPAYPRILPAGASRAASSWQMTKRRPASTRIARTARMASIST